MNLWERGGTPKKVKWGGHPWAGEDFSLKIDERDQTIQTCILEI